MSKILILFTFFFSKRTLASASIGAYAKATQSHESRQSNKETRTRLRLLRRRRHYLANFCIIRKRNVLFHSQILNRNNQTSPLANVHNTPCSQRTTAQSCCPLEPSPVLWESFGFCFLSATHCRHHYCLPEAEQQIASALVQQPNAGECQHCPNSHPAGLYK